MEKCVAYICVAILEVCSHALQFDLTFCSTRIKVFVFYKFWCSTKVFSRKYDFQWIVVSIYLYAQNWNSTNQKCWWKFIRTWLIIFDALNKIVCLIWWAIRMMNVSNSVFPQCVPHRSPTLHMHKMYLIFLKRQMNANAFEWERDTVSHYFNFGIGNRIHERQNNFDDNKAYSLLEFVLDSKAVRWWCVR